MSECVTDTILRWSNFSELDVNKAPIVERYFAKLIEPETSKGVSTAQRDQDA